MIQGLQIIGTQRSGSNLLRVMLNQSPDIAAPHPPHILKTFVPLLDRYGAEDYPLLVQDVVDFVQANPVPWEGIDLSAEALLQRSTRPDVYELFRLVYEAAAHRKGAAYWCCKSMANVHYAAALEAHGVRPKYLFLYRDGRDLAVSFKKAVVGEKHVYHIARQWKRDQESCLAWQAALPASRFMAVRYEALIAHSEAMLKSICQYLGIAYTPQMLQFYDSAASRSTAQAGEMWRNLTQPVMAHNTRKFLKELSEEEIALFETVAGDTLLKLGYDNVTQGVTADQLSPARIAEYTLENAALKKAVVQAHPEDMEKRKQQAAVVEMVVGARGVRAVISH